jgi:hypothetical protein
MTEPLVSTPRMRIDVDRSPAPPWSGKVFVCDRCLVPAQLEAGDVCVPVSPNGSQYLTPECPTHGCGHVNTIRFAESALALMRVALGPDYHEPAAEDPSDGEQDWNAS